MLKRRKFLKATGAAALALPALVRAQSNTTPTTKLTMEIQRIGSQPSVKGPADWFTGTVRIDPLFDPNDSARAGAATVTFEPGARTAWHTHPLGQRLIVTGGCGRVQIEGGPIEEIRPGDVVWFPPGVKHWHGAAPTTAMTHIAIQEALDGKVVRSPTSNTRLVRWTWRNNTACGQQSVRIIEGIGGQITGLSLKDPFQPSAIINPSRADGV